MFRVLHVGLLRTQHTSSQQLAKPGLQVIDSQNTIVVCKHDRQEFCDFAAFGYIAKEEEVWSDNKQYLRYLEPS